MPPKILLIEDERDVARMLGMALLGERHEVELADTAERARVCLASKRYDLVIIDHRLPDGNGIDIADEAARDGMKTLIISGYLFLIPAERAKEHELLMKPIRPAELTDTVKRLIG